MGVPMQATKDVLFVEPFAVRRSSIVFVKVIGIEAIE